MLLRASARIAFRGGAAPASGLLRPSAVSLGDVRKQMLAYSAEGTYSTYSNRQRYVIWNVKSSDPIAADFLCAKAQRAWNYDITFFPLQWLMAFSFMCMVMHMVRFAAFNPDVHVRRSSVRRNIADCTHYWAYGLPFYNHRLRNMCVGYSWTMVDNEGDYNSGLWHTNAGCRPERVWYPRAWNIWNYHASVSHPFPSWDWTTTTNSHYNMTKIYHDVGYKKRPDMIHAHEEEDD